MEKIGIIGAGGFGREVLCLIKDVYNLSDTEASENVCFIETDDLWSQREVNGINVLSMSGFNFEESRIVIAIGDPLKRKKISELIPKNAKYITLIHPSVIMSKWVEIGYGSIICAGTILTCNIKLGNHAHLNLHTTVGHDIIAGDFFTTAPAVNISGKCKFGHSVYCGTNVSFRENLFITDNVVVGMGAVVVKDITVSGVYIGNPLRRIDK